MCGELEISNDFHVCKSSKLTLTPLYKDWPAKKVTIFNSILSSENLKKMFYSFTYILVDYLVHEIIKEF